MAPHDRQLSRDSAFDSACARDLAAHAATATPTKRVFAMRFGRASGVTAATGELMALRRGSGAALESLTATALVVRASARSFCGPMDAQTTTAVEGATARIEVAFACLPRWHAALVDNGVALVHEGRVRNVGEVDVRGARLVVEGPKELVERCEVELGDLLASDEVAIATAGRPLVLKLVREGFARLTERVRGEVVARVMDGEGREVGAARCEVEFFPRDTWPGLAVLPELLAAFVLPNTAVVAGLVQRAAVWLERATGSPTLDEYQSKDPLRVLAMAGAVYAALQELGATYLGVPASFEQSGQRVRLPQQVVDGKQGNCLDATLLAAAVLEAAGLHALIVIVEGHAFAGVWLEDESFAESCVLDVVRMAKRVELKELVVFDAVAVLSRPSLDFDAARRAGEAHLERREAFRAAIDVHRARAAGMRPMALIDGAEAATASGSANTVGGPASTADVAHEQRLREAAERSRAREIGPGTRIDGWLRRLLDLSMRNRLLDCSRSRRVVPLLGRELGALEDRLANGTTLRLLERPRELVGPDAATRAADEQKIAPALHEALERDELRADLDAAELEARLLAIFREARTAREEGGANNLFLAIGFLEFREVERSSRVRRAPLLFVPLELKRGSARDGYRITRGDDDARLNVTLLEYLRQVHQIDVRGLDALPFDDAGVDVDVVLRLFREAVRHEDRWEVSDTSALGLFSFGKHLVWRDLADRGAELKKSALVKHLVDTPRARFDDGVSMPQLAELDTTLAPQDLLCPLSADSSQLRAILAAARGKTLVLEGPPGTGKSQTITNLVAHSLAAGKTVLFVSEKMAALEVVHRRLVAVGLGDACLELHSNKANKKAVLEQFRAVLDAPPVAGETDFAKLVHEVAAVRARLNAHVAALHLPRLCGESVHDVVARIGELQAAPKLAFTFGDPSAVEAATLAKWRAALGEFARVASEQEAGPSHPLLEVGAREYSPKWEQNSRAVIERFAAAALELDEALRAHASSELGGLEPLTDAGFGALEAALLALVDAPQLGPDAARVFADGRVVERVRAAQAAANELAALRAKFEREFRASPTTLDLTALEQRRRKRAGAWFLPAWLEGRVLRAAVRGIAREPNTIDVERAIAVLDEAQRALELEKSVASAATEAQAVLGAAWASATAPLAWLERAAAAHRALAAHEARLRDAVAALLAAHTNDSGTYFTRGGPFESRLQRFATARAAHTEALTALLRDVQPHAAFTSPAGANGVRTRRVAALRWLPAWSRVRGWCRYQTARAALVDAGLISLATDVESGALVAALAPPAFERAFAELFALDVISDDPALRAFDGREHEHTIARFCELDARQLTEVQRVVRAFHASRAAARLAAPATKDSPLGVLKHELSKKMRHKAIRALLGELGSVAQELKPCFLMSPLSVAQYLDPAFPTFDLVVFDEASQIPVWDAIGALARGKQAVVVGDSKQLPPTSFFDRGEGDAVSEEDVTDLESILDECVGAQVPSLRLAWHYRSRHEALIAFSNARYYDNELLTFPASNSDGVGVAWRYFADGVYDAGASRTNAVEARAVVDEIVRRLSDPVTSKRSIGVVTFSQPQQTLVLDLLDEVLLTRTDLAPFFDEAADEHVFVKNLENVQGDERDVILFSIGYGPDAKRRVSMNFGPLNKPGGERRLNVAVTRARREIVVFTSLRASEIDLSRSNASGVRDLRAFLEHVERSGVAVADQNRQRGRAASALVASIAAKLEARGHAVDLDVGCSGYRVDLAVRDPNKPGAYLVGIETDGPNYASAATARDRDALRRQVLEGLGWKLERVWAVDWWRDSEAELARLVARMR